MEVEDFADDGQAQIDKQDFWFNPSGMQYCESRRAYVPSLLLRDKGRKPSDWSNSGRDNIAWLNNPLGATWSVATVHHLGPSFTVAGKVTNLNLGEGRAGFRLKLPFRKWGDVADGLAALSKVVQHSLIPRRKVLSIDAASRGGVGIVADIEEAW